MGDPRKIKKKYDKPKHPWRAERIEKEGKLSKEYALKNKSEIWKYIALLRNFRAQARELLASRTEQGKKEEKQLLDRLKSLNLLTGNAQLDDVLTLDIHKLMDRRLQTQVYKKGLAGTMKQARQFIVHGHIAVGGSKVTSPSYLVKTGDEDKISHYEYSPVKGMEIKQAAKPVKAEAAEE